LKCQRRFAIVITRAYRTISREASFILADTAPLDLKIKTWADRYNIRAGSGPTLLSGFQYQIPANFTSNGHPASYANFVTENCKLNHQLIIYTDGSRLEEQTGCAFVAYHQGEIIYSAKFRLADYCSVFQAELFAIKQAVTWALNSDQVINIQSDSQSSLFSINDPKSRNPIAVEIRNMLKQRRDHFCLSWTKAHVGTEGNETA
ncbi:unnamed protein product, partial [Ectocarpus sp. 12 AP-2014]